MLKKLFQSKKSIEEKKIFEKDEIAKMLRVNPEQLRKFEETYQCEVLDNPEPSDDLFSMNAKDSKKEKDTDVLRNIPEDLVDRIVEELLDGTAYYKYQKGSIQTGIFPGKSGAACYHGRNFGDPRRFPAAADWTSDAERHQFWRWICCRSLYASEIHG